MIVYVILCHFYSGITKQSVFTIENIIIFFPKNAIFTTNFQ